MRLSRVASSIAAIALVVAMVPMCAGSVDEAAWSWAPLSAPDFDAPVRGAPGDDCRADVTPSIRYGASGGVIRTPTLPPGARHLIISHGYFFNAATRAPEWLNDTWRLQFGGGVAPCWERLALRRGDDGRAGAIPVATYRAASVVLPAGSNRFPEGALVMHGGDDGGGPSATTHVWGSYSDELWVLDVARRQWSRPSASAGGPDALGKRAGHSAVLLADGRIVFAFGGVAGAGLSTNDASGLGVSSDVHVLDAALTRWVQLGRAEQDAWPCGRRSAAMATLGSDAVVVHGGHSGDSGPLGDTWVLYPPPPPGDSESGDGGQLAGTPKATPVTVWTQVTFTTCDNRRPPAPRESHAIVAATATVVYITGGATCTPGCTCHTDLWRLRLDAAVAGGEGSAAIRGTWQVIVTPAASSPPIPVGRHSSVTWADDRDGLVIFGGESYAPYAYWNDAWALVPPSPPPAAGATAGRHGGIVRPATAAIRNGLKPQPRSLMGAPKPRWVPPRSILQRLLEPVRRAPGTVIVVGVGAVIAAMVVGTLFVLA